MHPNCAADLIQLLSPIREHEEWDGSPISVQKPKASIDDGFLFRRAIWSWHRKTVRRLRSTPPLLRWAVEVLLLFVVLGQVSLLVTLHAELLQSRSGSLAVLLTSALGSMDTNVSCELLRVEVQMPSRCGDMLCGKSEVRCEFAAERAVLELPEDERQSALEAAKSHGLTAFVRVRTEDLDLHRAFLDGPALLAQSAVVRHILWALATGPLREEVLRREPQNKSEVNETQAWAIVVEKWSLLAWGFSEFGGGNKFGSSSLSYFSCQGQAPVSLQAMRRVAELIDRRMEWWLFKVVWAFSTGVVGLLVAAMLCYTVRSSMLGCFKLTQRCSFSEIFEAVVLVLSPAGLGVVLCRSMGDAALDTAALFVGLAMGEVFSLALHTKESRYLFPRAALPAYIADAHYSYFHPCGFTWLAHSSLLCYQVFLFAVLWSHFETMVELPSYSLDQLSIEVKLRPRRSQDSRFTLSPSVQKLLLEQGLLLLGDNTSYETGVVMSAVISRAVQNMKVPCVLPLYPAPGATKLLYEDEALELIHPEALGGGAAVHLLLNRAFAGDPRCGAMLVQLMSRMRSRKPLARDGSGAEDLCQGRVPGE